MEYRTEKFTFFVSYYQAISRLKDPSERLEFIDALLEYAFCGVIPEFDDKLGAMFDLLKPNVDKTIRNIKNGPVNGRKGGAPQGNQNAKKHDENKTTPGLNQIKTDKEMEKDMEDGYGNHAGSEKREIFHGSADIDFGKVYTSG